MGATEADVDMPGLSRSQRFQGCFSPVSFIVVVVVVEAWEALLSSPPLHWKWPGGAYGQLLYRITKLEHPLNPATGVTALRWASGPRAGSGFSHQPVERGVFRLQGQCRQIDFISWANPMGGGCLEHCLLPSSVIGQWCLLWAKDEGGSIRGYTPCIWIFTLNRIRSPFAFSQALSPQRMCSDLAKTACQTLCQVLYLY